MCCSWFECWRQFLTLFCLFSSFFFHFSLFKLSRSSTIISILSGREIGLSFLHTVTKGQLNRKKQRESVTKNITKQNTYPNSTKKSTKINKNQQKKREKWKGVFASKRGKKTLFFFLQKHFLFFSLQMAYYVFVFSFSLLLIIL